MENARIADILEEIADLLELDQANEFRVRAYRAAARTVRDASDRLEDLAADGVDLADLPNIGGSTAEKIDEILRTGTCERLRELREKLPRDLTELLRVRGLGPRKAAQLHADLGVDTLDDLAAAARAGEVRTLPGFGARTEEKILAGIDTLASSSGRMLRRDAAQYVESLRRHLEQCDDVRHWQVAGSYRRGKETVGDLDVLVQADDRARAGEQILAAGAVDAVESRGEERITVHLKGGPRVDLRFFAPEAFGAALLYFTGSKDHNIALRRIAQDRGWKLSEYGLFDGERRLAGADEADVYARLDLPWIPPELREARGEIDAARDDRLPRLLEADDIRGDLQMHTTASDGRQSIAAMARAARDLGREYIAITDHSQRVRVAGGLDDDACLAHADAIREADAEIEGIWLLAGIEVDILRDGTLDLAHDTLRALDWVVAAVHLDRDLPPEIMTDRIVAAVESGMVHCLAHPLGRIIGQRDPMAFDTERVFAACAASGVCVEINAQPDRLDLPDIHCRQARDAGVTFTIATDAHTTDDLDFMRHGVAVARRGWLEKADVLNTRTVRQMRQWLQER
jgi:DNA polymerase (family 10)